MIIEIDKANADWLYAWLDAQVHKYNNRFATDNIEQIMAWLEAIDNPKKPSDYIPDMNKIAAKRKPSRKKKPGLSKEDKANPLICNDHPTYGGLRRPQRDCESCWSVYKKLHPQEYAVKRRQFERQLAAKG